MSEIKMLTDSNWRDEIGEQPALILLTNGEGLRGDFSTAFRKAAAETSHIVFARIDPTSNPGAAETFNANSKPIMVAYYQGETLVRRSRPWGSDVTLTIELLENKLKEDNMNNENQNHEEKPAAADAALVNDKPFVVTDNTFQQEVIDYSNTMPVLVDFWAEWCGPCRMVAPIMESIAKDFAGQVRVAKVDVDANPGLSQALRIMSIPTIMVFKEGQLVFNQPGALPEAAFRDLVQQVIDLDIQKAIAEAEAREKEQSQ